MSGLSALANAVMSSKRGFVVKSDNVTFEYCTIAVTWQGIWVTGGANTKIYHSTFYENECGINVSAGTNADIYNCASYNNTNIGIAIKANSLGGNASATIRECVIHSNIDGVWLGTGSSGYYLLNADVFDCDIYNNSNCGIRVFSQHEPTPVIDNVAIIRNNRIFNPSSQSLAYGVLIDNNSDGVWLYNNTIYNFGCAALYVMDGSDSNYCNNNIIVVKDSATAYGIYSTGGTPFLICNYNNIYKLGSGFVGYWNGDQSALGDWQSASGLDTNSIAYNPEFADAANNDFHLKSEAGRWNSSILDWENDSTTSPSIDSGNPADPVGSEPAPNGGIINQGAYGGTIYASKTPVPGVPTDIHCEGGISSNTLTVFDNAPEFSAVFEYHSPIIPATHIEIEVSSDNSNWTSPLWDTDKYAIAAALSGSRCADIEYGTNDTETPLSTEMTYYWRVKYYVGTFEGNWAYGRFMTGDEFGHYRIYYAASAGGNNYPYGHENDACIGIAELQYHIAAMNGDNNSNPAGTGTSDYDLVSENNRFTCVFMNGTYTEQLYVDDGFDIPFSSADYYITLTAAVGETPTFAAPDATRIYIFSEYMKLYKLISQGENDDTDAYGIDVKASYTTIDNCTISGSDSGIYIHWNADYINISNCTIYNNNDGSSYGHGIDISAECNYVTIENCNIYGHNIGQSRCIAVGVGSTWNNNCTIRNNKIHDSSSGIHMWTGTGGLAKDLLIENNDIYDIDGSTYKRSIYLHGGGYAGSPVIIRNNRIYSTTGNTDYGIRIDDDVDSDYYQIINNTFYNMKEAIRNGNGGDRNLVARNNIFCVRDDAASYGIYDEHSGTTFAECDHNCYYKLGTGAGMVGYYASTDGDTLADWRSATSLDANSLPTDGSEPGTDPLFADTTNADFHIKSEAGRWNASILNWENDSVTSPCIDACAEADDYSSETWYHGYIRNQGAYGNTPEASRSLPPDLFKWKGTVDTDWSDNNNWFPPYPGITVGVSPFDNVSVYVEAETNMPVMPDQALTLYNVLINTGNSLTGGPNTYAINGQISGDGAYDGDSGTLRLMKVGNGADAPVVMALDCFESSTSGTVSYEGDGDQEIWSNVSSSTWVYYNLNLAGSGTKSFNESTTVYVRHEMTIDNVTCSVDDASQRIYTNFQPYDGMAVDITGAGVLTGVGQVSCYGNCNVGGCASITIEDLRMLACNYPSPYEEAHLNIAAGGVVNVLDFRATQYSSHEEPISIFIHGPGLFNAAVVRCTSYGGDVTCYLNADITCITMDFNPVSGSCYYNDMGAHTFNVTTLEDNGNFVLDNGADLNVTGNCTLDNVLLIGHSGSVVNSDGEFDIGNLSMTAGELYIGDNDATWTPGTMSGGTVYYDAGGNQAICDDVAAEYDNAYYNLVLTGSGTKSTNGLDYCIAGKLTVQSGVTFSADNATPSRVQTGKGITGICLEVQIGATLTGGGIVDIFGNGAIASGATVDIYQLSIAATTSEDAYLYSDETINPENIIAGSTGSPAGTAYYMGPALANCNEFRVVTDGDPPTVYFGAPISANNVRLNASNTYLKDLGEYTLTVSGVLTGNGRVVLEAGGDIIATSTSDIIINILGIDHENSFIDSNGEFDPGQYSMTAGNLFIADNDATFNSGGFGVGSTVTYDGGTDAVIKPATYYNLVIDKTVVDGGGIQNCSATASGYVFNENSKNTDYPAITRDYTSDYLGFYKFNISGLPSVGLEVNAVRFYVYVYETVPNPATLDITQVTRDPVTTTPGLLASSIRNGEVCVNNTTLHRGPAGARSVLFDSASHSWLEGSVSDGWCAIGMVEELYYNMDDARYAEWDCSTSFRAPMLEVDYDAPPTTSTVFLLMDNVLNVNGDFTLKGGIFDIRGNDTVVIVTGDLLARNIPHGAGIVFNGSNTFPKIECSNFELVNSFTVSGYNGFFNATDASAASFLENASVTLDNSIALHVAGNFEMRNTSGTSCTISVSAQAGNGSFLIDIGNNFTMTSTSLISAVSGIVGDHPGNPGTINTMRPGSGAAFWGKGGDGYATSPLGGDVPGPAAWQGNVFEYLEMGSRGGGSMGSVPSGGWGGGAIHIVCGGVFKVSGTISAQGQNGIDDGLNAGGGGGAGGHIFLELTCTSAIDCFVKTGTALTAQGGNGWNVGGASQAGGGGGGGLIHLKKEGNPGSFSYEEIFGYVPGVDWTPWGGEADSLLGLGGGLGGPLPPAYPLNNSWDEEYLGGTGDAYIEDGTNEVTFVRLYDLRAVGYDTGIAVLWRSGLELDHAWYNVHRADSANGTYIKINPQPITGLGTTFTGGSYYFIDATAEPDKTYYYLVEDVETDGDSAFHGPVHASIVPGAPNPIDDPSLYVNGGSTDDTDLPFIPPVPHGPTMPGGIEILPGVVMYNTGCSNIILLEIFAEAPIFVSSVNHEGMPCTRIDLPGCGHIVTGSMPALPEMQITLEPLGAHVSMRLLEADLRGVQAVEDMMFNAPAIEQVVTGHIPPSEAKPGERRGAGWKDRRARFRWSRPVWTEVTEDREVPYGYGGI
ncbi:MAG: right-handed parallel beta-helix repeat-containing protein, partial [Planctomycetota bacterium]